jgi:DNA topoisomerase VI subunit B
MSPTESDSHKVPASTESLPDPEGMPRVHITIDRDTVVLMVQATESAAVDASEALRLAEVSLREAQEAVNKAQLDSDSAAARAIFVRRKVEHAMGEIEA